jgi:hypothetical protein
MCDSTAQPATPAPKEGHTMESSHSVLLDHLINNYPKSKHAVIINDFMSALQLVKIDTWRASKEVPLRDLFVDYCGDTDTEDTELNYVEFSRGMYFHCRH